MTDMAAYMDIISFLYLFIDLFIYFYNQSTYFIIIPNKIQSLEISFEFLYRVAQNCRIAQQHKKLNKKKQTFELKQTNNLLKWGYNIEVT